MDQSLFKFLCVCGFVGLLFPNDAVALGTGGTLAPHHTWIGQPTPAPRPPRYVPLEQVLPRATQESGVQFAVPDAMLQEEVPVRESGPEQSLELDLVLDEFSRVELYGDDSELQGVILLDHNRGGQSPSPTRSLNPPRPSAIQKPAARPASPSLPTTQLSKEQLQKLVRGPYRSPLPDELWDDPEYQEFLIGQGITSREEMKDRNKAKNLRKTVRRLLLATQ